MNRWNFRGSGRRRLRGSGNTVELDPERNPRRVWFKEGATEQQKQFAAIGRGGNAHLVEKHSDGSWTVQSKPPGSPATAIFVTAEQREADAKWIERQEPVQQSNGGGPQVSPGRSVDVHLKLRVRNGRIERAAVWNPQRNAWQRVA